MAEAQRIVIQGGKRLEGEIEVQGAKNSALPLLAASSLCSGESTLHNCPRLTDCDAACRILNCLGCRCKREMGSVSVNASAITNTDVPSALMREMRSSIVFLGAILGRTGHCRLSFPGGCELGPRPIDFHLEALRKMGVAISEEHGYLDCTAPKGIHGADISLAMPSVGATENIMLAAVLAKGTTEIHNAAREPEIVDLADFLVKCGAKINGAGESTVYIEGVERLGGCEHRIIPDRIAAATYLCCGAITRGELMLTKADYRQVGMVISVLERAGCSVYSFSKDSVYINAKKALKSPGTIRTSVHPGFPTDAQPLVMALCTTLKGTSIFVETIFENRYKHAGELTRLGAKINIDGRVAVVEGVERLSGAELEAADLRGGAALITAGLFADGVTKISNISHIDRGYENIEKNLRNVGADIKRS